MKGIANVCCTILMVALLGACKSMGIAVVDDMAEIIGRGIVLPLSNPDLLKLAERFIAHKVMYNAWPNTLEDLQKDKLKDSVGLSLTHFRELHWTTRGDTVSIDFALEYDEMDTSQIRFLSGSYAIYIEPDTSVFIKLDYITGETKDGTIRWNGFEGTNIKALRPKQVKTKPEEIKPADYIKFYPE